MHWRKLCRTESLLNHHTHRVERGLQKGSAYATRQSKISRSDCCCCCCDAQSRALSILKGPAQSPRFLALLQHATV